MKTGEHKRFKMYTQPLHANRQTDRRHLGCCPSVCLRPSFSEWQAVRITYNYREMFCFRINIFHASSFYYHHFSCMVMVQSHITSLTQATDDKQISTFTPASNSESIIIFENQKQNKIMQINTARSSINLSYIFVCHGFRYKHLHFPFSWSVFLTQHGGLIVKVIPGCLLPPPLPTLYLTSLVAVLGSSAAGREIGGKFSRTGEGESAKSGTWRARSRRRPELLQGDRDTPCLRLPALLLRLLSTNLPGFR